MKVFYVYIVRCSDGKYYTGITNNLERRIYEHNAGNNSESYTYSRRPVKLVYSSSFQNVLEAIRIEKKIKKWSQVKKEALINNEYHLLPKLSKSDNNS